MSSVSLHSVQKSFGGTAVVRALDLEVGAGELVALLGPSGCGKTTTLRMIAGLERADSGRIVIADRLVDDGTAYVPPERRGLGMVFQSYAIWPHRSVEQNVAYPLSLRRVPRDELTRRVSEALDWVRLRHLRERMPHQLSGGQLQRVALARALVAGPEVMLLDEPLSNLDAALREELRAEIAALRARVGTTMLYVTHDQSEALALSDRIAVMNRGVIEQIAAPEHIYREPATPFVAAFVGGANVLPGEVRGRSFHVGEIAFGLPPTETPAPGPAELIVRPEDLVLGGESGAVLTLTARLFLGHAMEYRFLVGDTLLRAVGPETTLRPGDQIGVRLARAKVFPQGGLEEPPLRELGLRVP